MIFICNYDPFGYDRVKYTIRNMCVEEPEMPYDDGAQTTVLYTKGTKGDDISEELRQFLNYMENTTQTNAVNDTLKDIQKMVDIVKRDGEVSSAFAFGGANSGLARITLRAQPQAKASPIERLMQNPRRRSAP